MASVFVAGLVGPRRCVGGIENDVHVDVDVDVDDSIGHGGPPSYRMYGRGAASVFPFHRRAGRPSIRNEKAAAFEKSFRSFRSIIALIFRLPFFYPTDPPLLFFPLLSSRQFSGRVSPKTRATYEYLESKQHLNNAKHSTFKSSVVITENFRFWHWITKGTLGALSVEMMPFSILRKGA
ncbi:hypothetical protein ACFE04_008317 [Oxalis oulophora]